MADNSFQPEQSPTSYDRCLLENEFHQGEKEISIIRLSKMEALNTRNTTPEVYSVLMECKANGSHVTSLQNCLSQNANIVFKTKQQFAMKDKEEVTRKCSSLVTDVQYLNNLKVSNKFNLNIVPYLNCVYENLGITRDGCLYIARFLEVYEDVSKKLVTQCFGEGAGSDSFDFVKFWKCYYN